MISNLLDPVIIFFVLGILSGILKNDLKLPEAIYDALSIYLLLAIGYKGGLELSKTDISNIYLPVIATVCLGIFIPVIAFIILSRAGKFKKPDSAAIAAHYGSVSAVTFAVALDFLHNSGIVYDEYMTVLLVMLEIPAIAVGILLARFHSREGNDELDFNSLIKEILFGKSIYLLLGGLIAGYFAGLFNNVSINKLFLDLFKGFLAFFLLEMGIIASKRFRDFKKVGPFLISFGVLMPVLSSILGIFAGLFSGLSLGGTFVLACMAASASYIAAPTAMRIAVPEANPTYYITASLGITFPFNIIIGLPIYYYLTELMFKIFKG